MALIIRNITVTAGRGLRIPTGLRLVLTARENTIPEVESWI